MASSSSLGAVPPSSGSAAGHQGPIAPAQPLAHHAPPHTASPPPPAHPLGAAGGVAPAVSQSLWSTRLLDLLDLVRHEFDVIGNDAVHFKTQRDEMEHRSTLPSRSSRSSVG